MEDDNDNKESGWNSDCWEYDRFFVDCTCDHDADDHGWMSCNVQNCLCKGHWEEQNEIEN